MPNPALVSADFIIGGTENDDEEEKEDDDRDAIVVCAPPRVEEEEEEEEEEERPLRDFPIPSPFRLMLLLLLRIARFQNSPRLPPLFPELNASAPNFPSTNRMFM